MFEINNNNNMIIISLIEWKVNKQKQTEETRKKNHIHILNVVFSLGLALALKRDFKRKKN